MNENVMQNIARVHDGEIILKDRNGPKFEHGKPNSNQRILNTLGKINPFTIS